MIICNCLARLNIDVKGLIFDCDGVLFDSRLANIKYYNAVKKMCNLPTLSPEEEDYIHIHSVQESFQKILPQEFWPKIPEIRKHISYDKFYKYLKMEPGLRELLIFLKQKNIRIAINTNRTNTMFPILYYYDLHIYFSPVVTADTVVFSKPHPESVYLILDKWKLSAHNVAYIGDSILDAECALQSKVFFWSYKNPDLDCDLLIWDFYSLRTYLKDMGN
ncbi:MAG: HAD family hydrolase [Desulfonauticus sp.]|nr:HAD family hydrolase [Desulfonauticus sp.]